MEEEITFLDYSSCEENRIEKEFYKNFNRKLRKRKARIKKRDSIRRIDNGDYPNELSTTFTEDKSELNDVLVILINGFH